MPTPDPASPLAAQIRAALRANELGSADPYAFGYAGLGASGPSIGIFQGDLAVNSQARSTVWQILVGGGMPSAQANQIIGQLAQHCTASPLRPEDDAVVAAALASDEGRAAIDKMDDAILAGVLAHVGSSIDAAAAVGLDLDPGALCAIALWCNMTGAPSTLNRWLVGEPVALAGGTPPAPAVPTASLADVVGYLALTDFFRAHPRNLIHFQQSVAAGLASDPNGSGQGASA